MAAVTFDTLKFAKTLKAAGVPEQQAEAEAAAVSEALQVNFKELATKDDIQIALAPLKADIQLLKWMCGVGLTMGLAILVRLFFGHPLI
ncbi:MAG TPA: hypothetical protein VG097_18900 [Gemmata sp.]|jgi:hypothetical protein|nr:hypothetical protein [Gemmata sp.]